MNRTYLLTVSADTVFMEREKAGKASLTSKFSSHDPPQAWMPRMGLPGACGSHLLLDHVSGN